MTSAGNILRIAFTALLLLLCGGAKAVAGAPEAGTTVSHLVHVEASDDGQCDEQSPGAAEGSTFEDSSDVDDFIGSEIQVVPSIAGRVIVISVANLCPQCTPPVQLPPPNVG